MPADLARHIDRVRRRQAPHREGFVQRTLTRGWLTARPGADAGEFASATPNRVHWFAPDAPIGESDLAQAAAELGAISCPSAFIWIAPWACPPETLAALARAGATRVPYVEYIALSRPAGATAPPRPCTLDVRPVTGAEAPAILDQVRPWYWPSGADTALRQFHAGVIEIHAAFDGPTVAAIGLLTPDGDWAYLGSAFTREDYRGRGVQSALICARVTRAAALGARWCSCETNTVVPVSLRNLHACGFESRISWSVFRWRL